jgi:hypothetical protein
MFGDHVVATPLERWCILVAYWFVIANFVISRGYMRNLYDQEWMPLNALYAASLILRVPVFLSTWSVSAFAFRRPWSLFATIVYPIGCIFDTLMWYAVFDIGKGYAYHMTSGMAMQYFAGYLFLSLYVHAHRQNFALWYLPEHLPPIYVRGNRYHVPAGIASSFLNSAIYHWYGDLRWCVLVKFVVDLYCCIRIRMPAPWMTYKCS